jgi:hypothetical protein
MFGMLGFVFCKGPIHDIHAHFLCMICAFPRRNVSFRIRTTNFKDEMG